MGAVAVRTVPASGEGVADNGDTGGRMFTSDREPRVGWFDLQVMSAIEKLCAVSRQESYAGNIEATVAAAGGRTPNKGHIYLSLKRLRSRGFAWAREEGNQSGRSRKRQLYALTKEGRAALSRARTTVK